MRKWFWIFIGVVILVSCFLTNFRYQKDEKFLGIVIDKDFIPEMNYIQPVYLKDAPSQGHVQIKRDEVYQITVQYGWFDFGKKELYHQEEVTIESKEYYQKFDVFNVVWVKTSRTYDVFGKVIDEKISLEDCTIH